jgi:hypothetical protein
LSGTDKREKRSSIAYENGGDSVKNTHTPDDPIPIIANDTESIESQIEEDSNLSNLK